MSNIKINNLQSLILSLKILTNFIREFIRQPSLDFSIHSKCQSHLIKLYESK